MAIMTNNLTINWPSPQTDQTARHAGRFWLPLEGTRDDRVRRIHVAGWIPRVEYGDTECVQGTAAGYEHIEINMAGMNGDEQLGDRMSVTATKRTLLHSADQVLGANSEDDQPVCREMVAVLGWHQASHFAPTSSHSRASPRTGTRAAEMHHVNYVQA